MKDGSFLMRFKKRYSKLFYLTEQQKNKIASKNLRNVFILLHITSILGFINFCMMFFRNLDRLSENLFVLLAFGLFTVTSIIGLFYCAIVRRMKKANHYVKDLPMYLILAVAFASIMMRTIQFDSLFTGITLIATLSLIAIIFCDVNPYFYCLICSGPSILMNKLILSELGPASCADFDLFIVILAIVSFYKRAITVENLKHKEHLEKEYDKQQDEIASQATEIFHQYKRLIKSQENAIFGMANLVEQRCNDGDSGQHLKRTTDYADLIARAAQKTEKFAALIDEEFIDNIIKSAPLHDIGKLAIPEAIVTKPGKFTPEEFEIMKKHSEEGYRVVKEVFSAAENMDFVNMACDIAYYHHEKWDGNGYPKKLKGTEIPLSARIMAIADVFDALISKRCYKDAFSYDKAFEIIKESAGSHFDPELVEIFLSVKDKAIAINQKYGD